MKKENFVIGICIPGFIILKLITGKFGIFCEVNYKFYATFPRTEGK